MQGEKDIRRLSVNGLAVTAAYYREDTERLFLPLLRRLSAMAGEREGRVTVFLAAPPAMGKSTLGLYLEALSREDASLEPVRCVGLDGFHYTNAELDRMGLRRVKGAPETFDARRLGRMLGAGADRFPVYSRKLHEPVEDAVTVTERILIVEGNWLLLNESPWNELTCDLSVFMRPDDPSVLRSRLIARKIAGGSDEAAAAEFVDRSDMPNIAQCLGNSRKADVEWTVGADGRFAYIK